VLAYLHDSPAILQCHRDTLLIFKSHTPDSFGVCDKIADKIPRLEIPNLDPTIAAAADNPRVVELQACDAVVMGGKAVNGAEPFERPYSHGSITTAGDQSVATHL
jgi:hypothetical protein